MKRALLAALLLASLAEAQAIRTNPGFNLKSIPRNDDGSSPITSLGFTINFFGKSRAQVYVNNNGNITFDNPLATYTPFGLVSTRREIIAPFFADVDTRPGGSRLVTYGPDNVNGHAAFGVNFINVGYFNNRDDKLNSFQVVLIDRSDVGDGNFDIEFNYERILWETGDASGGVNGFGGVPATVGWSNGTGEAGTSFQLDGSLLTGSFLDGGPKSLSRGRLNSTIPGRFIFRARGGQILPPLTISTACPLPSAAVNTPYSRVMTAFGGGTNYRWELLPDPDASLPAGLSFNTGGTLSGTPATPGTSNFTLRVTAATEDGDQTVAQRCSLTIDPPRISITSACPLPQATVGQPYNRALQATGSGGPFTWSVDDPANLPIGISVASNGTVRGTPLAPGNYTFVLRADGPPAQSAQPALRSCSMVVAPSALQLTTACNLPDATTGVPYAQQLLANGGSEPYRWSVAGDLPPGLSFSSSGAIMGTPRSAGNSSFSASVIDGAGRQVTQSCSLRVSNPTIGITTACPLPAGAVGTAYSQRLAASGGTGPYAWSLIGALPAGLTLTGDGVLSGNPIAAGGSSFRLLATDSLGNTVSGACSVVIAPPAYGTTACPLPNATVGVAYSRDLNVIGGTAPFVFSTTDPLPRGLTLNSFGRVTGTPLQAGNFPFNVKIVDSLARNTNAPCSLRVDPSSLLISGASCPLPNATVGTPFSAQFNASGGTAPYQFGLLGSLPAGLRFNENGAISGTPTAAGASDFLVVVIDALSRLNQIDCSVTAVVPDPPSISIVAFPEIFASAVTGPLVTVQLSAPYTLPVQVQLKLTGTGETGNSDGRANISDPRVAFPGGQSTVNLTIPAGERSAATQIASSGTVAASYVVSVNSVKFGNTTAVQVPSPRQFRVARTLPVITDGCFRPTSTGADAVITGYTTTRSLTNARFSVTPVTGAPYGMTIDVTNTALDYFLSDDSVRNGGAFTITFPFVTDGTQISGATVTLSNSAGSAASKTLNKCQ